MMTTIDPQSVENQRICQKLVEREVHYCVSSLVDHFAKNEAALLGSEYNYDDILELCTGEDWEAAWDNSGALLVKDADDVWWVVPESNREHIDELGILGSENADKLYEALMEYGEQIDDPDDYKERCEALDIDPETMEIYEHWIVSGWFAERLKEKGHPTGELFGMTIWGRPTTGQAIYMDWVIGEIAKDMEILKGQKYEWSE